VTSQELVGPIEYGELVGDQMPTYQWVPPYEQSAGAEAVELAASAGLILDPWQELALEVILALNRLGRRAIFEICIILSRQNGKGSVLEALELAWLFLFGEQLVTHSAHLFETSRLHFTRMMSLIEGVDDFDRRIWKVKEGRGAEEIILHGPPGSRRTERPSLKFMTRKGGAARGFTSGKIVLDEAMILDATMMSSALPTLATKPEAQVIYTGSAGFPTSTQLGLVRSRAYAKDPAVALLEWAAQRPVYDENGRLIAGDDPADPRTWARVNPSMGPPDHTTHVISQEYIRNEMGALGGPHSPFFWRERLGIGDYPVDDERWAVVSKDQWDGCLVPQSTASAWRVHAFDTDPVRDVTTMVVASWATVDGVRTEAVHLEVVARHRGSLWCAGVAAEHAAEVEGAIFVVLPSGAAAHLKGALAAKRLRVETPAMGVYAAHCEVMTQYIRGRKIAQIGQSSLRKALGGADKRTGVEGGWVWSRDVGTDQAPIVSGTLALWGLLSFPEVSEDEVGDVW
jgi:hypothetical protein